MRQRTHQPRFALLIFILVNFVIFVSFVVNLLFSAYSAVVRTIRHSPFDLLRTNG